MKELIKFKSGLRLIVCENTNVKSLAIGVYVGAGVVTETENEAGISHFIEHMAFKGTQKRTAYDIVDETDKIGANINAATAKQYTVYYTESLDVHAEKCVEILSDIYFNPKYDKKDLIKERKVIYEEIHESEDDPFDVLVATNNSVALKGSQFANEILGTKKSLSKIDSKMLKDYHDKWYIAQNTVICFAGNITVESAKELIEKYFEPYYVSRPLDIVKYPAASIVSAFGSKKRDIAQSHILFTFPDLIKYDDEFNKEVLGVITLILDGGMSTRLFQNIRERLGVCYTIGCMKSSYKNNGRVSIYTSTSPDKVEQTVKALRKEIDKLVNDGVYEEELSKAKEFAKTSFVLGEERTKAVMSAYGVKELLDNTMYDPDRRYQLIDKITVEDVNRLIKQVFNKENLCASLVAKNTNLDILKMYKD